MLRRKQVTELAERAKSGDRDALGRLCEDFAGMVHRHLSRQLGLAKIEDHRQEVMLRMVSGIGGLRDARKCKSWVFGICVRYVFEQRRDAKRRKLEPFLRNDFPPCEDPTLQSREDVETVRHAMSQMDTREVDALLARAGGEKAPQAMSRLGLSSAAYYRLLTRARSNLAEFIQQEIE